MTFQKGQSGNPGGRPKIAQAFRERAQLVVDNEGFRLLQSMLKGEPGSEDRRYALTKLLEYGYGKPQQHVDLTSGGQPLIKALRGDDLDLLELPEPK